MKSYRVTISTFIAAEGWFTVSTESADYREALTMFDLANKAPGPSIASLEVDGRQVMFLSTFAPGVRYSRSPAEGVAC